MNKKLAERKIRGNVESGFIRPKRHYGGEFLRSFLKIRLFYSTNVFFLIYCYLIIN